MAKNTAKKAQLMPITDREVERAIKVVAPDVLAAKRAFETLAQRQLTNRDHYLVLGLFDGLLIDMAETLALEVKAATA